MTRAKDTILGIIRLLLSPAWFWAGNTVLGVISLCAGITEICAALIKRNKEKK